MRVVFVTFLTVLLLGCGYQMVGMETHRPPGITSIAIPTFVNQTFEPSIEVPLTQGFLREFIQDRRVKVVDRKEADSILEGVIKSYQIHSISYDRSGVAQEYQTTVKLDLTLRRRNGEVLWIQKDLTESRTYRISTSPLMTESNKASALQSLGRLMAESIKNRFFCDF